jgi:hypothetical protein
VVGIDANLRMAEKARDKYDKSQDEIKLIMVSHRIVFFMG